MTITKMKKCVVPLTTDPTGNVAGSTTGTGSGIRRPET
jgi:hypothetical protein